MKKMWHIYSAICQALLFVVLALFDATIAKAGLIDIREINSVAEVLIVDTDLVALGLRYGSDGLSALTYSSWVEPSGWSGDLTGVYNGTNLNLHYEGYFTSAANPTDPSTISYVSSGTWAGETLSGNGSGLYIDPDYSYQISPLQGQISGSISGQIGIFNLSVTGSKSLLEQQLKAEIVAGFIGIPSLGSVFEAGGGFRLSQSTGKDESYVFARTLFRLIEIERVVDRSLIWHPQVPPEPGVRPPQLPQQPDIDYPPIPPDGIPGFDPNDPLLGGYHQMYVGPVPEPTTIALVGFGLSLMVVAKRRNPT